MSDASETWSLTSLFVQLFFKNKKRKLIFCAQNGSQPPLHLLRVMATNCKLICRYSRSHLRTNYGIYQVVDTELPASSIGASSFPFRLPQAWVWKEADSVKRSCHAFWFSTWPWLHYQATDPYDVVFTMCVCLHWSPNGWIDAEMNLVLQAMVLNFQGCHCQYWEPWSMCKSRRSPASGHKNTIYNSICC